MNFPLFIAKRIFSDKGDRHQVSRPAIRIATIGVAIGLAVMIITISVVLGFKHTVRDKVVGFGSHLQVYNIQGSVYPLCINDSTLAAYEQAEGVSHAERFTTSQGILKTDNDFLGVMLKGIGPEYDIHFINDCIVEGELPAFTDSTSNYPLVISKTMAQKLRLHAGDRVFAYFIGEKDVRARRFNVSAIYQTNMKRFDDLICLTDISVTQRLNGWDKEQCTGAELLVNDFDRLKPINSNVTSILRDNTDRDGNMSVSYPITDIYPQVFSWLELLDINVWIILGLMIAVAGFTMISGLLIIILERTQMIGILKALGARNDTIRHTFLWFAAFIIGRGLLWGNILGIGLVVLQQTTGIVTLDAQTYYVSEAPMELNLLFILLLNAATLLISVFVLIAPSYLVSHIHPARSMHYE
ncbi:FtsX-like permease family protein [uncultured Prevotella sp.]|uniref:ABC transporter permease n=1 Tax=uncultured Prevotella sp. TaxID=159272 RepID=UPI0025E50931|nr:FtsX-like permease family protein [uncultured Prevotella sp.]